MSTGVLLGITFGNVHKQNWMFIRKTGFGSIFSVRLEYIIIINFVDKFYWLRRRTAIYYWMGSMLMLFLWMHEVPVFDPYSIHLQYLKHNRKKNILFLFYLIQKCNQFKIIMIRKCVVPRRTQKLGSPSLMRSEEQSSTHSVFSTSTADNKPITKIKGAKFAPGCRSWFKKCADKKMGPDNAPI